MTNFSAPARTPAARLLAVFAKEESGAARTDLMVAGLAVVAVLGILVMSDMESDDPVFGGDTVETTSAAPARTVSSVGFRPAEPEPQPGGAARRGFASEGFEDRFASRPDTERARLDAQRDAAIAAEVAAGGPPPVAEAAAAEAAPTEADQPVEAVAAEGEAVPAAPADGDG